ncbi:MAG: glycosyltransferase family 2 protein [Lachnospiraceae bacterium]|nr:glycosyltransferase family 2 protein [Lachnospiraceae bacterium]
MYQDEILVSIITPSHNTDPTYFRKTADSVLKVLREGWEWVLILHNNETMTPDEVREIIGNNPFVRIIERRDGKHSPSAGRNYGLSRARGKYVYFLDHDDLLQEEFLPKAVEIMEAHDYDILIGNAKGILENEKVIEVPLPIDFPDVEGGYLVPNDPVSRGKLLHGCPIMVACKVIRRDLLTWNRITFDEEVRLMEDTMFALRAFAKAKSICVVPSLLAYTYVQHGDSLLQRMLKEDNYSLDEYLVPLRRVVNLALENGFSPNEFLWVMLGMFTRIYQKGDMDPEKKRILYSAVQEYLPLMRIEERRRK